MKQTTFSSRLAYYRKRAGLKQEELAVQLNVTPQAVSKWENGSFPDGTLLPKISQILGVSLDILFGLKDEEPEPDYLQEYMKNMKEKNVFIFLNAPFADFSKYIKATHDTI